MKKRRNIGIRLLGGSIWMGGVNYSRNLVITLRYLSKSERPNVTLFVNEGTPKKYYEDLLDEYTKAYIVKPKRAIIIVRSIASRVLGGYKYRALRKAIKNSGIDVLLPLTGAPEKDLSVKWLGWIPDFQHLRLPEMFSADEIQRRETTYGKLADKADMMIFSSRNCEADFDKFYLHNNARRKILSFCAVLNDNVFKEDVQAVKRKYHLPEKFLFLPNQFWKHKNHITAFKAMRILKERGLGIKLFCSGSLKDPRDPEHIKMLQDYIQSHGLRDNIIIMGMVPRTDQIKLMRLATALIQPTLFEGWSTVVEEGKSLGKVMFISDLPVNKEQDPMNTIFFARYSAEDLADKIQCAWNSLKICPDAEAEAKVKLENKARFKNFATTLMDIVNEV